MVTTATISGAGANMVGFLGRKMNHKVAFDGCSIKVTCNLTSGYVNNFNFLSVEEFSSEIESRRSTFTYIQPQEMGNKHQSVFAQSYRGSRITVVETVFDVDITYQGRFGIIYAWMNNGDM